MAGEEVRIGEAANLAVLTRDHAPAADAISFNTCSISS